MPAVDSFNPSETSFSYPWPSEVTGLERILLSAQGDLQRVLSAFFASPITVERVSVSTSPRFVPASPTYPIIQTRKINLLAHGRLVGFANSTVTITSAHPERLFLDDKYAIGQVFRVLQKVPQFTLCEVGLDKSAGEEKEGSSGGTVGGDKNVPVPVRGGKDILWRRYKLSVEGFACDIVETFPDRSLFIEDRAQAQAQAQAPKDAGNTWVAKSTSKDTSAASSEA